MKQKSFIGWMFVIALAVLINVFTFQAAALVFENPQYDEFCESRPAPLLDRDAVSEEEILKHEAEFRACNDAYQIASDLFEKQISITLLIIHSVLLIVALYVTRVPILSRALGLGAVIGLIIALMRYWSHAEELLRLGVLGLIIILLITIGLKTFKE
jgi:hypothetical protein